MKKILLSLFVGLIGLINFGYCDNVATLITTTEFEYGGSIPSNTWRTVVDFGDDGDAYTVCFTYTTFNGSLDTGIGSSYGAQPGTYFTYWSDWAGNYVCFYKSSVDRYLNVKPRNNSSTLIGNYFILNDLLDETLPELTENECKQKYNLMSSSEFTSLNCQQSFGLIPIIDIDENYCVSNGLCPSVGTGNNWSALFINDIQHLGKPVINITFPDYLDWDYTTTDEEFNLDIVGYPVDTEYIDGVIRTQNYKPTSEDFTQLVGMLAPYSKYLLFLLFIFIIWAWIKKPFKSKKL